MTQSCSLSSQVLPLSPLTPVATSATWPYCSSAGAGGLIPDCSLGLKSDPLLTGLGSLLPSPERAPDPLCETATLLPLYSFTTIPFGSWGLLTLGMIF